MGHFVFGIVCLCQDAGFARQMASRLRTIPYGAEVMEDLKKIALVLEDCYDKIRQKM